MPQSTIRKFLLFVAVACSASLIASAALSRDGYAASCPQNRNYCNGAEGWSDSTSARQACGNGSGNFGAIWFNNSGGNATNDTNGYYSGSVYVGATANTVNVTIRGSVLSCRESNWGQQYGVNVGARGPNAYRLYGLSSTVLYRGNLTGVYNGWSTQGGSISATLNVAGLATNNKGRQDTQTITIGMYRCYSTNGVTHNNSCYSTDIPVTVVREPMPITWNLTPSATITSAANVNLPGQTLTWQHQIRNNGPDTTNKAITFRGQNQGYLGAGLLAATSASGIVNGGTRTATSTRQITQNDVGNTLCRRTTVTPQSSTNNNAANSSSACRTIPYRYTLTPAITNIVHNTVVESNKADVPVQARITNNGPTKSHPNVTWRLTQVNYNPGQTPNASQANGGIGGDPCSFFTGRGSCANITPSGQGTVANGFAYPGSGTYSGQGRLEDNQPGSRICFVMSVRPYDQAQNGQWRHSQLYCLVVGKKPKVQVWGGDISVGRQFNGGSLVNSSISTSLTQKSESTSTQPAPSGAITNLWKTGVDESGSKLAENQSDPHWSVDRVYRPSGSASTCQRGYTASGTYTSIPTAAGANFQARTVRETSANVNAGQYITHNNDPLTGNNVNTNAVANGPVWNRASTGARWIATNLYGQNYSANNCNDPTRFDGTAMANANIYVFKQRQSIMVADNVNLDSIRLTIEGAVDNLVKFYVNGCELRATYPTVPGGNWQEPGWRTNSVAGAEAYVVGGASGCATGASGFRHGPNSFEVRVQSTYSHTGLLIDKFTATATVTQPDANIFGSWGEYGVFAPASINLTASASGLSGGNVQSSQSAWSNYTFTARTGGTYGAYSTRATQLPDPSTVFPAANAVTESNFNVSTTAKGRVIKPSSAATAVSITANSGPSLRKGQWLVINATGKNVVIKNDLTYENGSHASVRDIPQLIIIANSITIESGVRRVDAWLVARNALSTCEQKGDAAWLVSGSNYTANTARLTLNDCNNELRINGPVIANKLYLRRTYGAGAGARSGDPAEIINLRPDTYLWANQWMAGQRTYRTTGLTELSPRY